MPHFVRKRLTYAETSWIYRSAIELQRTVFSLYCYLQDLHGNQSYRLVTPASIPPAGSRLFAPSYCLVTPALISPAGVWLLVPQSSCQTKTKCPLTVGRHHFACSSPLLFRCLLHPRRSRLGLWTRPKMDPSAAAVLSTGRLTVRPYDHAITGIWTSTELWPEMSMLVLSHVLGLLVMNIV